LKIDTESNTPEGDQETRIDYFLIEKGLTSNKEEIHQYREELSRDHSAISLTIDIPLKEAEETMSFEYKKDFRYQTEELSVLEIGKKTAMKEVSEDNQSIKHRAEAFYTAFITTPEKQTRSPNKCMAKSNS